jgi:hypothetical protein
MQVAYVFKIVSYIDFIPARWCNGSRGGRMRKLLVAGIVSLLAVGGCMFARPTAASATVDDTPDCDTVAIIKCGFKTMAEMRADYRANDYGDVHKIYNTFGISAADLKDNSTFKPGIVWRDGRVTVDGKVVATKAMTAGRWNNPTSDMTRMPGTVRAYKMDTSHFTDEGQTAFIKVDNNGKFLFAVIKSCGNPVSAKAKPVPQPPQPPAPVPPTPAPTPTPPAPAPAPTYSCTSLSATLTSDRTYQYTVAYTATNGAALQTVRLDFGDSTTASFTPDQLGSITHQYQTTGTYTTTATLSFNVGDTTRTTTCATPITVACQGSNETGPQCTSPPAPKCQYNAALPADSPDCKQPVALVNTGADLGPGTMAGVFAVVASLGVIGHAVVRRRLL